MEFEKLKPKEVRLVYFKSAQGEEKRAVLGIVYNNGSTFPVAGQSLKGDQEGSGEYEERLQTGIKLARINNVSLVQFNLDLLEEVRRVKGIGSLN